MVGAHLARIHNLHWDPSQGAHRRRLSCLRFNWLRVRRVLAKVSYTNEKGASWRRARWLVKTVHKSAAIAAKYACNWREGPAPLQKYILSTPAQCDPAIRYITLRLLGRRDTALLFMFNLSRTKRKSRNVAIFFHRLKTFRGMYSEEQVYNHYFVQFCK